MKLSLKMKIYLVALLVTFTSAYAFSCSFKTSCSANENDILHLSDLTNAHLELASQAYYPYKLCCEKPVSVSLNPAICDSPFISLSSETNAHAGNYTDYNYKICLNDTSMYGFYNCTYRNSCESNEVCTLSLSSQTNAHAGDCNAYNTKVCCEYKPYIDSGITPRKGIGISPGNIINVLPGDIVEAFLWIKNYYHDNNEITIDFNVIQNSSGVLKDVTDEWKNTFLIDFCEYDINTKTCKQDVLGNILLSPGENKTFLYKVLIPNEAEIGDSFNTTFEITSKTLNNNKYYASLLHKLSGGKIEININARAIYYLESKTETVPNLDVNIYICRADVEWCDESTAIYKYKTKTNETGYISTTIYPALISGRKYKISLVTEKGYSEATFEIPSSEVK